MEVPKDSMFEFHSCVAISSYGNGENNLKQNVADVPHTGQRGINTKLINQKIACQK